MTFTDLQRAELTKPLSSAHVRKPSGSFGPKGDYLEGWHVINELNRVFGFDGWSYTVDLSRDALVEGKDSKGNPQWQAAYTCVCTLKVGDVTRQDVGFGSGFAKAIGDAIEGATKEATTDALKRCARTFGNIFGLALYDKARTNVEEPMLETTQRLLDGINACETLLALKAWLRDNKPATDALSDADYKCVTDTYNTRKVEVEAMDRSAA